LDFRSEFTQLVSLLVAFVLSTLYSCFLNISLPLCFVNTGSDGSFSSVATLQAGIPRNGGRVTGRVRDIRIFHSVHTGCGGTPPPPPSLLFERCRDLFTAGRIAAAISAELLCLKPFKAYWLRDAPTGSKFNSCTLCPHSIYVFCIYLRTNSDVCPI
jgi:hypothetical protein